MKIIEIYLKQTKIKKIQEVHLRLMKIKQILELHARINKFIKKQNIEINYRIKQLLEIK